MNRSDEPSLAQAPAESIGISVSKLRDVRWQQMALRFCFGAITSVVAGGVSLLFDARAGGVFLAFPAILAATLTLIEKEEDSEEAREDARGALPGSLALAGFATIVALTIEHLPPALSLAIGAISWAVFAIGLYILAWGQIGVRGRARQAATRGTGSSRSAA